MKRNLALFLTLVLCLSLFAGCTGGEQGEGDADESATSTQLNLFTWEGMFPQEILNDFESETGISINYVNFDFDETMLAKLEAANGGDYDLVIADDYIIETVIAEGLAQQLDKDRLENYDNINSVYQSQFFDPTDAYTVPYGAGVQTIVYDPAAINWVMTGYADLWDESLVDSVGIIANHRVINGMALKVNGESYNTEDEEDIQAAGELMLDLAPNIRLIKDDNIQDDLLSGEISAAVMYTSQVTMAMLSNPDLQVVYPKEGIGFGVMAGFIPSEAPHADAAYAFLDYLLRPEVSASCFEWLGYYCTNEAAEEFIAEEFRDFLILPSQFGASMEMIKNVSAETEELHAKIWTEFKAACGQ